VFSDAGQEPEERLTQGQDVQSLVDSVNDMLSNASPKTRAANTSTAALKDLHSLGSLLDGFVDRVADLEKSERGRMEAFQEIRCSACEYLFRALVAFAYVVVCRSHALAQGFD
jgi:uncharacterized protein (DUF2342 family)